VVFGSFFFSIVLWIIGLFILYLIISTAVKDGINKSVVGQFIEKKNGIKNDRKSFLDSDLDNEK
jgi:ABC-type lipoprotein release transport system permease subunit